MLVIMTCRDVTGASNWIAGGKVLNGARGIPAMQHLTRVVLAAVVLAMVAVRARAQGNGGWVGERVITRYGTVLKVGRKIVDDEKVHRIYTVEQTNGPWLWLVAEKSGVSGWVQVSQIVPFDQAIDFYTSEIRANPGSASAYVGRGIIWGDRREYDIAIADFNEAIRLDPKDAVAYNNRGLAWKNKQEYDKAIVDYDKAIRLDPKFAWAYNNRAWLWATCPDAEYRDGPRAVESATRACELTDWKEAYYLGTRAAADAEAGDFDSAVRWQEKALALYRGEEDRRKGSERLALYRQKRPYHEETELEAGAM
jgi:tetratricopeptide (TPR) repeat protein